MISILSRLKNISLHCLIVENFPSDLVLLIVSGFYSLLIYFLLVGSVALHTDGILQWLYLTIRIIYFFIIHCELENLLFTKLGSL